MTTRKAISGTFHSSAFLLSLRRFSTFPKSHIQHAGKYIPLTSDLRIISPNDDPPKGTWPAYRIVDEDGTIRFMEQSHPPSQDACIGHKHDVPSLFNILKQRYPIQFPFLSGLQLFDNVECAYKMMIRLRQMDDVLQNAQRQGRISFYMTCRGEEAIHIGSASALEIQDVVLAQYREAGVLMWRGFTLEQFANQCFSNDLDLGKGRQMPIHYGSKELNYHTISSPLGTQLPQSVGVAYKLKLDMLRNPSREKSVAICYFGDGCASTPDFHSACNFAATLKAPVIFFCRNNGYAISTPVSEQYASDGIVVKGPAYGMASIRVDGNDLLAVHAATAAARAYAIDNLSPVLIEAMTYRLGHHSTSDDSSRYRPQQEVIIAKDTDPLARLHALLKSCNLASDQDLSNIMDEERVAVIKAMEKAEHRPKPGIETMFTDVYSEKPIHLQIQEQNLLQHLAKHKT